MAGVRSWVERVAKGEVSGPPAAAWRCAMWPLSWLYRGAVAGRRLSYRSGLLRTQAAPVPVISVGNLTTGGTGKTPFVEWLARRLVSLGRQPAIVSRGYRADRGAANDEFRVLAENLPHVPHILDPQRARGAHSAVDRFGADCIILDDGFQHLALKRDLDLVLIDASQPFGNGSLLPAGVLREPLSGLARADLVVLSRVDAVSRQDLDCIKAALGHAAPGTRLAECVHGPVSLDDLVSHERRDPSWLEGRPVFWFCGLGNPRAFDATLRRLGAEVVGGRAFRDHHLYDAGELSSLAHDAVAAGADAVVTTQKDRVKLSEFRSWRVPAYSLKVAIQVVDGEDVLAEAVANAVCPAGQASGSNASAP